MFWPAKRSRSKKELSMGERGSVSNFCIDILINIMCSLALPENKVTANSAAGQFNIDV